MRRPNESDIPYFIEAGRAFCEHTAFLFDAESYAEQIRRLMDNPDAVSYIIPGKAHCAAMLVPNLYNETEIIARVFTTWGDGGLHCFDAVEEECRERGARFIIADSYIEPKVMRFYRRKGMKQIDQLFMKAL